MAEYRRGAHTVFEIHLHLVWITKYRRPALQGEVATRVRDLIRDICGQHEVSIMKGHVSKDHVHLLISLPPQVTISRLMQWLKGRTAHHLLAEFPHLKKQFWGRHLWARGYFCCSSGNVTDEVIAKYIAEQNIDQDEEPVTRATALRRWFVTEQALDHFFGGERAGTSVPKPVADPVPTTPARRRDSGKSRPLHRRKVCACFRRDF